ncbi:MAG: integrase core domain-containing protein [Planctomycetota bacterium]
MSRLFIEREQPVGERHAERFDSRFRDECLPLEAFDGLRDSTVLTAAWTDDCNRRRPQTRSVSRPRPGSPPRVRLPARPRLRLQPHTRPSAWVSPVPEQP